MKASLLVLALTVPAAVAIAHTETTAPNAATAPAAGTAPTTGTTATTGATMDATKPATGAATAEVKKAEQTVEGPIAKVVPAKKEIYVQGPDKKHEFYFKPNTELTQAGKTTDFSTLKEGMRVRVTFVKVGKRQDPVKVEIIQ